MPDRAAPGTTRLLHVFSTFAVGGPQLRFVQLARHFGDRFEHLVVAMDGRYDCADRLGDGVVYRQVDAPGQGRGLIGRVRDLRRTLNSLRPDLLITYNWGAIEWALANYVGVCPQIHIEDGFGPEEATGQLRRRVLFRRLVLARAGRVVLPSRTLYDIAARVWRLDPGLLCYLPNGIDCARFARPPEPTIRARLQIAPDEIVVGTLAVLRREKNLGRLIRAFAAAAADMPAKLVIIGDGSERRSLEDLTAELGLTGRVVFTGHLAEPAPIIALFDLFAISSDTEQMPYSVVEAMAAGLSVAGTDVGDIRRMVAPENHDFIVAPDTAALTGAIGALLADPARRQAIGRANRDRAVAEFDQAKMFEAYDTLFSEVAARDG